MLEKRGIRLILTKSKENVTMILQKSYSFVNYNKNVLTKDKIIYNIDIQKREIKSVVSISFWGFVINRVFVLRTSMY